MKGITGNPVLDAYQRGGVSKVGAAKPAEAAAAPAAAASTGAPQTSAVEVSISSQAKELAANAGPPVNHAKVESVKNQIANGTFHVDSKTIAQKLFSALG